ncbi:DUF7010 family protein [Chryseobacterium daecheongense]|uniref:Uncharacterized protein n=1 Tax=Chryseobacterium daecheongense TaxID=192389 RepID=A0A3N0W533_9FLAO|nr:hypothetical protein [Chryseobacterium daecheongense]ROI00176.1 hypothetical protein EGI05_04635 [Chryseobacterium daecheongense]TDX94871.1 hypothetical protein BCF50_0642 [Chryseobacterium daecheongense]
MENKDLNADSLSEAQKDMGVGYGYGSIGVFVSGSVWLVSSLTAYFYSFQQAVWVLMIGGVFIFPLATLMGKLIGIKGQHSKNNPLGKLAMEGTIWMIMCIPLAYGLSLNNIGWFFQGMMMIVGGRYLTFASLYGTRLYWMLGGALGLAAYSLFTMKVEADISSLVGGLIEILFSFIIYSSHKK